MADAILKDAHESGVALRDARVEDCEDILSLLKELAEYEEETHIVKTDLELLKRNGFGDEKRFHCFVAEDVKEEVLIGFLLYTWIHKVYEACTFMFIESLYVKESYRRRGIGKRLMDKAIEAAKTGGYGQIRLVARRENKLGLDFYKKLGMVDASADRGWHMVVLDDLTAAK